MRFQTSHTSASLNVRRAFGIRTLSEAEVCDARNDITQSNPNLPNSQPPELSNSQTPKLSHLLIQIQHKRSIFMGRVKINGVFGAGFF